jgi:hypothetical protein
MHAVGNMLFSYIFSFFFYKTRVHARCINASIRTDVIFCAARCRVDEHEGTFDLLSNAVAHPCLTTKGTY